MSQIVGAPEAFDWLELAMMRLLAVFVSLHDADETAPGFDGLLDRCSGQMDEIMSQVVDAWARLISDDASLPMIQKALIALAERRVAAGRRHDRAQAAGRRKRMASRRPSGD